MAKKRKAYLHVGMPGVGDVVEAALAHHRDALVELGVAVPARTAQESFAAAVEIKRDHKNWGFKRREVEGAWSELCYRVRKGRNTVVFSSPLLAGADTDQIALLLDGLAGFEVHAIVTATAPHGWCVPGEPETDLAVVLDRWGAALRSPERVHVVLVDGQDSDEIALAAWRGVGRVAGFGTASLGLADVPQPVAAQPLAVVTTVPPERAGVLDALGRSWADHLAASGYDVVGNVAALGAAPRTESAQERRGELDQALQDALREIERLSRRNASLEQRLDEVDRKRRRLKKRLSEVA